MQAMGSMCKVCDVDEDPEESTYKLRLNRDAGGCVQNMGACREGNDAKSE